MAGLRTYQYGGGTKTHHRLSQFCYLENLDSTRRLLNPPDELIAKPWRDTMTTLVDFGAMLGRSQGPMGTKGRLRANVKARVQNKAFPMWAAARSRGVRRSKAYPKGFAYPRLLNYSPKHGHTGWFDRTVIEPIMARAGAELDRAADEVERRWSRQ